MSFNQTFCVKCSLEAPRAFPVHLKRKRPLSRAKYILNNLAGVECDTWRQSHTTIVLSNK